MVIKGGMFRAIGLEGLSYVLHTTTDCALRAVLILVISLPFGSHS